MEQIFNQLSESLFSELNNGENLILSFDGEKSQFIRFNHAKVRQTGLVDDADLGLKFISNNRSVHGGFTVSGNFDIDIARGKSEIIRMRLEAQEIPEDPFVVFPKMQGRVMKLNWQIAFHLKMQLMRYYQLCLGWILLVFGPMEICFVEMQIT